MRRAYVAIVDLRLGRLPQRCLVTGEPTGNLVRRRLHLVPSWTWLAQVGWGAPPGRR